MWTLKPALEAVYIIGALLLAGAVPLAIVCSKDRLRRHRAGILLDLEAWIKARAPKKPPEPFFEPARIKYEIATSPSDPRGRIPVSGHGRILSYILPAGIYSGLSALSFIGAFFLAAKPEFWESPNFILSGMQSKLLNAADLAAYQWNSGAAITAGFLGGYLFTLQYLMVRVRNYELSPASFLTASLCLIESMFIVSVARHLIAMVPHPEFGALAFILGYFPSFGLVWLVDKLKVQSMKRSDPDAFNRRFALPTDMIDGIDTVVRFRLMESGIHDVQNLASANPILLYVETPYTLLTILDWIAQAQVMVACGGQKSADLRAIGIRTVFDVQALNDSELTQRLVLAIFWPDLKAKIEEPNRTKELYAVLTRRLLADLHTRRLVNFWIIMTSMFNDHEPPAQNANDDTQLVPDALAAE